MTAESQWSGLLWSNLFDIANKKESNNLSGQFKRLRSRITNPNKPLFIYFNNSKIIELKSLNHTQEAIQKLNQIGIDFYLLEPLCSYLQGVDYTNEFYHRDADFYNEFLDTDSVNDIRSHELDSILEYATRNNLTNITVHTCDYMVKETYPFYSRLNLVTNDMYVKALLPPTIRDESFSGDFNKKFISLNLRYTIHKNLIAAYMSNLSSYVSFNYEPVDNFLGKIKWLNTDDLNSHPEILNRLQSGLEFLSQNYPLTIDLTDEDTKFHIKNMPAMGSLKLNNSGVHQKQVTMNSQLLEQKIRDVFLEVVTESRFAQPTGNFSEKVYRPMWHKKPFILVSAPYSLKYLKEQGFKSFSDFWDESYDTEPNHAKRIIKIFEVIDFLNSCSIEELREMYNKMKDILYYNYKLVRHKQVIGI